METSATNRDTGNPVLGEHGTPVLDDTRWAAVLTRDRTQDGTFVTAVITTGIYCRPSCPARHPKRENVRFYDRPEAAERAGYRACLRCKPKEAAVNPEAVLVDRVRRHLEEHRDERVTLDQLARITGRSPFHLQRTFKRVTGVSPRQYAASLRLDRFKERLRGKESVTMALYEAGYGSSSRLYERSAERMGMTPASYRSGGLGAEIRFAVAATPIGNVLVGATERGVCSVKIGATPASLERDLRREFPAATIRTGDASLRRWVSALTRHLEGTSPEIDLPLDMKGTAFQWKVWEALRAIPYGETRSYREVARSIGAPKAARAVGHACATNPVAILVPCHRVVREGGGLGGYAYGLAVKKSLLDSERSAARRRPEPARARRAR
ncbi:MAG TPA: bifunctional DNA-binding transcriptional regulator/O6-methylguanine-DNA methyltransferase Ada [Candidatus Eisenbacteria bacterium]|nr:bifunctional DNA-binding transcriptional regulator/O6-methylguanine-DNA methyltransferase Ada [Candidatus Eisenbacteria bacterium]